MRYASCVCLLVAGFSLSTAVQAAVLDLMPDRDNTLYQDPDGILSNGQGEWSFAGANAGGYIRRGLLHFDLSQIPAGSTIQSVQLTLRVTRVSSSASATLTLHEVQRSWGEGISDALFNEGGGTTSEPGDATWIHTFHSDQFWQNPGGDFSSTVLAGRAVTQPNLYVWSNTPAFVSAVQGWVNNPGSNFGILVRGNELTERTAKRFGTSENPTVANRPVLRVTYEPIPEPATGVALLCALAAVVARRR